jgi:hypothetical protein
MMTRRAPFTLKRRLHLFSATQGASTLPWNAIAFAAQANECQAMQEIINCPSCQRRLQVPDSLIGQDVQCPTCGATFVASVGSQPSRPAERLPDLGVPARDMVPEEADDKPRRRRRPEDDDYGDYDDEDDRYRRRRRRDLAPHRGAVVLTLGILSIVICGIILGPIAWALGSTDMKEIREGRMDPDGEGITNAGRICGIIGTFLHLAGMLCWFFVFLANFNAARRF